MHEAGTHLTPASSICAQLWVPSGCAGQSISLVSVPRHWTLSNQICPAPLVKPEVRAMAPECCQCNSSDTSIIYIYDTLLDNKITCGRESQLSAGHLSIRSTPEVITHCAPDIVVAYLHTSLSGGASLESDGSSSASCSSTPHSSIFNMPTVVGPQWSCRTVNESGLSSTTLDIVQPDLTNTIGETSGQSNSACSMAT